MNKKQQVYLHTIFSKKTLSTITGSKRLPGKIPLMNYNKLLHKIWISLNSEILSVSKNVYITGLNEMFSWENMSKIICLIPILGFTKQEKAAIFV